MAIEKIDEWDWPDYLLEPDGYDTKRVPVASADNLKLLTRKLNEVIDALNASEES